VRFIGPEGDDEHYRVVHYRRVSNSFDGPAEVVHMPIVVANQDGVLPFTNAGIEQALAGTDGWYIYGACDHDGMFVVQALIPRQLVRARPQRIITARDDALAYVGRDGIKDAAARKGQATSVFIAPPHQDPEAAQADWREDDEALLIHVFGGIGGEQAEPALKASPFYWGHFAFGVARVVREPLADELSFDIEYLQVYAHNADGMTSGALHWSRYMGDRQYGWLGTRPVRDVLIRVPCFTGRRGQASITPLALMRRYLEMMTARYRIGGGGGSSLVTLAYNCSQDSNQALYAAFKVITQNLARQERRTITAGNGAHEQDLADLLALGNDLERYLVPFGGARTDWASDAGVLGSSADLGGLQNMLTALRSWRTILPSVAARTLIAIFLRHGASAWVLDTYQCGGNNPRISPVMPNV
jgi:predicted Abi (CAAX) family protease